MVETDPEVPLHRIMKDAPIIQLLADGDDLKRIVKQILRSDADYIIMAEARDGIALDTALKIAAKGTRRVKITFHNSDPEMFAEDVAAEIVKSMGGDPGMIAARTARSFDYVFHFSQLRDKSKKRLRGIYELRGAGSGGAVPIMEYDRSTDSWKWHAVIGSRIERAALEEDPESCAGFIAELERLSGEKIRRL
jgi:pilus assembly protein CpaF